MMKKLSLLGHSLVVTVLTVVGSPLLADHHNSNEALATGAVGVMNLVAQDPSNYVASQKSNGEIF